MSRGTPYCFSQIYLEMLRDGPVLAHEFGNVSPALLTGRLSHLSGTLPHGWYIDSRWVNCPSKLGLRIHEKLYSLIVPLQQTPLISSNHLESLGVLESTLHPVVLG